MDYISCSLRNLAITDYSAPIEIKVEDKTLFYILFQEPEILEIPKTYNYSQRFGKDEVGRVLTNYVSFSTMNPSVRDPSKRAIITNNFYAYGQLFSNALWFIRDNPVTPYFATISSDQEIEPVSLRRNVYYSTAKGAFENGSFDSKEIAEALMWMQQIQGFVKKKKSEEVTGFEKSLQNMSSHITFDVPSFHRAYYFLDSARKSDFLPGKIALYISVLESLLAVKGDNVHKTGERVAKLIGLDATEKWELYKQIEHAYGLRSDYVHGSYIPRKINSTLPEVSEELDKVVRRVFKEMLLNHQDLNYDTQTKKHVNSAFIRMVLS